MLRKFMAASTLEERLPLITKSRRTEAELKASSLNGPLPRLLGGGPESAFTPEGRMRNSYHTLLMGSPEDPDKNIVVTVRLVSYAEDEPPRIQTDAFLDLYEKVPEKLAKNAIPGPVTINCIIQTSNYCFEDGIPNGDEKATITLKSNVINNSKDLGKAFLRADSDLFKKLRDRVPAGTIAPVTLTLDWNKSEDPSQPYIEVVRINSLNW